MVNSECFHRQEATFYTYDGNETRFSRDISPIILAAQRSEYAIINMLVQRGATIEKPHRKRFFISYYTSLVSKLETLHISKKNSTEIDKREHCLCASCNHYSLVLEV